MNNNGAVFVAAVIGRFNWTSDISLVGHENTVEVACYNPHIFLRNPAALKPGVCHRSLFCRLRPGFNGMLRSRLLHIIFVRYVILLFITNGPST